MDRRIADCAAVAGEAIHDHPQQTYVEAPQPPGANNGWLGGLKAAGQAMKSAIDNFSDADWYAQRRPAVGSIQDLPPSYDFSSLKSQFDQVAKDTHANKREILHPVVKRPLGGWDLGPGDAGRAADAPADAMRKPTSFGAFHYHDFFGAIDSKTNAPAIGAPVSGGDAESLIRNGANFTIAGDRNRQTMFVRTNRTPTLIPGGRYLQQQQDRWAEEYWKGGDPWETASRKAAMDTAARYYLGFYEGENGVLNKAAVDYEKRRGK